MYIFRQLLNIIHAYGGSVSAIAGQAALPHAGGMLRTRLDISLTSVLILRFMPSQGRIPEGAIKPEVFPARCDS